MQVMAMLALPHIEPRNWVQQDWSGVKWGAYLNVMFWYAAHYLCMSPCAHCLCQSSNLQMDVVPCKC